MCQGLQFTLFSAQTVDPISRAALHAKGYLLLPLCTHCRPMMTFIKGLQYMQRTISYLLSTPIAGPWWPLETVCNACKGPFLTCSVHSLQAYDNLCKGSQCVQRAISCTLTARVHAHPGQFSKVAMHEKACSYHNSRPTLQAYGGCFHRATMGV